MRDWERVEHYANTLEASTKPDDVRWGTCFSSWARALAAWQGRRRDQHLQQTLVSLAEVAAQSGLVREASRIRQHRPSASHEPAMALKPLSGSIHPLAAQRWVMG